MDFDSSKAADDIFSRKSGLPVYAAIGSLTKDSFSTSEITQLSGVKQPDVSKELKALAHLGMVLDRGHNAWERVANPFWALMGELIDAWGL